MILTDLLIVFAVAGVVVYLFQLLRVPAVVGLLVAGVVVGPHALGWVANSEDVHLLADVGVAVLLFSVGLEFSLSRVLTMSRLMLLIGLPQVLLSIGATTLCTWGSFGRVEPALFVGMLVAMSSTAIVIKTLADRSELDSGHGRVSVAVLLLQDLLVVFFVLVVPLLAPEAAGPATSPLRSLLLGVVVVSAILLAGKFLLPGLLYRIVRTRNRELFLIMIFLACIGTATLTASVGLSLALGAFLAGLTISESEYGHQTLAEVLPFRDTLSSLFFISVGMLLDVHFVVAHWPSVLGLVALLLAIKFAAAAGPAAWTGYPLRTWLLSGLALAQIGEFSFVLASTGRQFKLLDADQYQTFLAAAVVTMALTPFLIALGPGLANRLADALGRDRGTDEPPVHKRDHVIIAGYGFNGRNLARALRDLQLPYVVLDMNPEAVRAQLEAGEAIEFGDCTRPAVLLHAGIETARVYVVAISDPVSTRRSVQIARQLNPRIRIVVRSRFLSEIAELRRLGADQVIPEDFETSVAVFARVLEDLDIAPATIMQLVEEIRADHYRTFGELGSQRVPLHLPVDWRTLVKTWMHPIAATSAVAGQALGSIQLRTRTGASILALRRGTETIPNPGADAVLQAGDAVLLLGDQTQVAAAVALLDAQAGSPAAEAEAQILADDLRERS
jgi:CPA2 family monovalent cation:H+ antiporter-2